MLARLRRVLGQEQQAQMPRPVEAEIEVTTPEEVLYAAASRFLDVQVSTNDVLDNKSAAAFSVGSTVLPVTFGLLRLSAQAVPPVTLVLLALALVAYVGLVVFVWLASRSRRVEYRPDLVTLQGHSETTPGANLQRWVANEYIASIEANELTLDQKGEWVGRANTALYAEGFLLSLAALVTLW